MKNSKIGAIVKNDVERSIKNKWFVILNICMLLFTVIGLNFNTFKSMLNENNISVEEEMLVYVEDPQNLAYEKIYNLLKDKENIEIEKKESVSEYENNNIDENTVLLKVYPDKEQFIKATIITKEGISSEFIDEITAIISSIKDTMIAQNKNLTSDEIETIKNNVQIEKVMLGTNVADNENASFLQLISNYLIFFILLLCLNKIANTVSQEKMSKSIEYILTSITAKEYMISKVLSMSLIVIVQFVFTLAYLIIALMLSSILNVSMPIESSQAISIGSLVNIKTIGYVAITLIFMCFTTFLQGIIQAVMSAKTTNIQEAGNATFLLVMVNLVLYTIVTTLISPVKTVSAISYILSVIPIASMYFVPAMFIMGQSSIIQVIISLIILIASIPLVLVLAQKPFKNAILDFTPKKEKKIDGIEKILSTREYQERILERKDSSKKGLVIGMAVILLLILQLIGGLIASTILEPISNIIKFISKDNIYLILSCLVFIVSIYLPYLLLKLYIPKEEKQDKIEDTKEDKKQSAIKCIKYIIVSIPIISIIQMVCSFAIEKLGLGVNVTDTLGLFNYSGILSTILIFMQVAILPAIFEELFIRKGVIGILKDKGGIFAAFISSLIFATIHMNVSQFIFAFLIGILFAIVRLKTNKMYPTIILHFINNGFAVISALFYNHMIFMQIFTYFNIILNAVGFCLLIYMLYLKVMELKDKESIERLKEQLDYRKIKLNIIENMFVFKDFTFAVTVILSVTLFMAIDKMLTLI